MTQRGYNGSIDGLKMGTRRCKALPLLVLFGYPFVSGQARKERERESPSVGFRTRAKHKQFTHNDHAGVGFCHLFVWLVPC